MLILQKGKLTVGEVIWPSPQVRLLERPSNSKFSVLSTVPCSYEAHTVSEFAHDPPESGLECR